MIKIKRKRFSPEIKNRAGNCKITVANQKMFNDFDGDPDAYNDGTKSFTFDSSIYGHETIKTKLKETQFGKCAFCESSITHIDYGDVEHFRPKGGYCQNIKSTLQKPGYYWLAYDWENLLFTCNICNRRYKKNLFPLLNPEIRALNHNESNKVKSEKPFFVNPARENPKFLIQFKQATAIGIDKRLRGKKTIEALHLNRKGQKGISDLYERRLSKFEIVENTYFIATSDETDKISKARIDKAKRLMQKLRSSQNEYSAMINDNFPRL